MRTVEYYLEKGFALPYAEYFANGRKSIGKATANDDFSVTLEFDNGERRKLDMKPTLKQGGIFESFNDISRFKRLYIDDVNDLCGLEKRNQRYKGGFRNRKRITDS